MSPPRKHAATLPGRAEATLSSEGGAAEHHPTQQSSTFQATAGRQHTKRCCQPAAPDGTCH
eukprot:1171544-Alexandrium_andersonii.AAC.1